MVSNVKNDIAINITKKAMSRFLRIRLHHMARTSRRHLTTRQN